MERSEVGSPVQALLQLDKWARPRFMKYFQPRSRKVDIVSVRCVHDLAAIVIRRSVGPPYRAAFSQGPLSLIYVTLGSLTSLRVPRGDRLLLGSPGQHQTSYPEIPFLFRQIGISASPKTSTNDKVPSVLSSWIWS